MKALKLLAIIMLTLIISMPFALAAQTQFTYDANGNVVHDGDTFREYNSLNQLYRVYNGSDNTTLLAEYTYHPVEERVLMKKVYDAGVWEETIYYISDSFVSKKNSSGLYNETYVHLNGVKIAQVVDGEKQFIHSDHLGSSSVITNSSGDVIETTHYSPYGGVLLGGESSRYDYESRENEPFGTMDFRFRQYSPEYGMFMQPDSILINVHDPQSLNRFMFERGSPYYYIDPTGHVYWDRLVGAAISGTSSLVLATGGVGLTILGVPTSVAPPVGVAAVVGGVALSTFGFANFGDAVLDGWAAIIEDDAYFLDDKGGILANTGDLLFGDEGAKWGARTEAAISAYAYGSTIPGQGANFYQHWTSVVGIMDTTLAFMSTEADLTTTRRGSGGIRTIYVGDNSNECGRSMSCEPNFNPAPIDNGDRDGCNVVMSCDPS